MEKLVKVFDVKCLVSEIMREAMLEVIWVPEVSSSGPEVSSGTNVHRNNIWGRFCVEAVVIVFSTRVYL